MSPQVSFSEPSVFAGSKGRLGNIQDFIVPNTSQYLITAYGARGGTHSYNYGYKPGTYYGGKGAEMQGLFYLTNGTVLKIVVGQKGGDSVEIKGGAMTTKTAAELGTSVEDNAGTGGGGGSFVYTSDNNLLIAAGGGGGASGGYHGRHGEASTAGSSSWGYSSSSSRSGGTAGQPGQCNTDGSYHGGVGAGWLDQGCERKGTSHGERGGSRDQDWLGGLAGRMNSGHNGGPIPGAVGGFGGGGGGAEDNGASGGGGGFSGGGSGRYSKQAGGGGGSYCGGQDCVGVKGNNPADDGIVIIEEKH